MITQKDMKPQFMIAAPMSGAGKTTICRGLMELFTQEGYKVQPFKCGPDYIDTKYHEQACGRPSINLDSFMAEEPHLQELYQRYSAQADVCIVEGMMGLYDGYDRLKGSSADIARILHLPVVLVVDAQSSAYSMAALIYGFQQFNKDIQIKGVIFNKVGSEHHAQLLMEVCQELDLCYLGSLHRHNELRIEDRYLGLDFASSSPEELETFATVIRKEIDWRQLLTLTSLPAPLLEEEQKEVQLPEQRLHIAVARNQESFSFIYAEHLVGLERLGKVSFFDPEREAHLPDDIDLLYLPGGYPEKQARVIAENDTLKKEIYAYIEQGGRTLAECGGMIYLSKALLKEEGAFPMVGIFPFAIDATSSGRRLSLGYRKLNYKGLCLRGHEFHYTQVAMDDAGEGAKTITQVYNAKGIAVKTPIYRYKNTIASYTHLYWGEINPFDLF